MSHHSESDAAGSPEAVEAALRERIGKPIENTAEPWCYEATRDNIRHYAHGIGDEGGSRGGRQGGGYQGGGRGYGGGRGGSGGQGGGQGRWSRERDDRGSRPREDFADREFVPSGR